MKLLVTFRDKEYIVDVTDEQLLTIRKKFTALRVAAQKLGKTLPDYSILNLDVPDYVQHQPGRTRTIDLATTDTLDSLLAKF